MFSRGEQDVQRVTGLAQLRSVESVPFLLPRRKLEKTGRVEIREERVVVEKLLFLVFENTTEACVLRLELLQNRCESRLAEQPRRTQRAGRQDAIICLASAR